MSLAISLSILEYERQLGSSMSIIEDLLDTGLLQEVHIDVMRHPFIDGKNTCSKEYLTLLCRELDGRADLDFHLMARNPIELIEKIHALVRKKERTTITIHREAYRYNLGPFNSKEYDLARIATGNDQLDAELKEKNFMLGRTVSWTLSGIKRLGYNAGLALEPGTDLENISPYMVTLIDRVLLMGVSSGAGGQSYQEAVTEKVRELRGAYGGLIQVDGGINAGTISQVLEAGANRVVIGSYITKAPDPVQRVEKLDALINGKV